MQKAAMPTQMSTFEAMLGGAVAKAVGVASAYPIRLAKVATQGASKEDNERTGGAMLGVWQEAWRRKGILGLYEGLYADIASCSLKASVKFWLKETLTAPFL